MRGSLIDLKFCKEINIQTFNLEATPPLPDVLEKNFFLNPDRNKFFDVKICDVAENNFRTEL